jgi:DNA primase
MARIPDAVIERLKAEVSVQRLAEGRGVVMKRHGADLHGCCPFHDDKTPSLVISPAKNLWHCLGACQAGGSVIDWVMKAEGVSFRHASELLLNDYHPAQAAGVVKKSTVPKLPTSLTRDAGDGKLLAQVIDYYHATLLQSPQALAYLDARGIRSEAAISHFKLGFANRTLGYRLPAKNRVEGAALRGQLQRIGLYRPSGHEHFSGSLVIPILDEQEHVQGAYGRKITEGLRDGTPLHLYLPGPHRGVWNVEALASSREIILCEALIDALTFWCAGYRNVTASYGVEGFTNDHLAAFKAHGIERVLIAYDRDEAGDRAAGKLAEKLTAEGFDCYRLLFPKGMDANDYALKVQPATKSLGVVIRSAQWLGKGAAKPLTTQAMEIEATPVPIVSRTSAPALSLSSSLAADLQEAAKEKTPAPEPPPPPAPDLAPAPTLTLPTPALPAAVIPDAPAPLPSAERRAIGNGQERQYSFGDRRYRVRGLEKNLSYESLKVNLLVSGPGLTGSEAVHVDTLDLYQARPRAGFAHQAAIELGVTEDVLKADLGKLLLALESEQEKLIQLASAPKKVSAAAALSDTDRDAALSLLRRPDLLDAIAADFTRIGIVGEATNALVGYLAAVSRKLDRPLALLIQSTSAAGKSSLLDAVLRLVPEEDRIQYSAMTGQSLFYMGEMDLKHKILAIAEEEGASRASYALKLLQSEGELTIASTSKDATTGKLTTEEYHVEGPVMIALTTTAAQIDEELLNRCLVLSVDEGRQQTAAIHQQQRKSRTLSGLLAKAEREAIAKRHQDAQRLLQPLCVVNPFADSLTFLDDRTRTRRDHEKYLTLIDAIALLHQHQREVKTIAHGDKALRFIEATIEDIALANRLAHEVLGRTLDELPPQTRRLLTLVVDFVTARCKAKAMLRSDFRFSRRDVREATRWGDTQLRVHLDRLTELEYVLVHRGGRGQSFVYELLYDGQGETGAAAPHLCGLLDVTTIATSRGQDPHLAGSTRPHRGASAGESRTDPNSENTSTDAALAVSDAAESENTRPERGTTQSHRSDRALAARGA